MAETYRLRIGVKTNRVGSTVEESVPLIDYGCSDEEWEALTQEEQDERVDEWVEKFVRESTYSWGEVYSLGSLCVGDKSVTSIRTYTRRESS